MKRYAMGAAAFVLAMLSLAIPGAATDFEDLTLQSDSYYDGAVVPGSGFDYLSLSADAFHNGADAELTGFDNFSLLSNSYYNGAVVAGADFDDLVLATDRYYDGADEAGDWQSGGVTFSNNYNAAYGSWDGFAYSNMTDTTTPGYGNQYSAIPGGGQGATTNYAVGYVGWASPPTITLPSPAAVSGLFVTNSTYAYLSMLDGDAFSKKFGGETGADEDWFLLTVTGKDADGNSTGAVDFYLADFQDAQSANDYIVSDWRWVDLSALGTVSTLEFTLTSSDTGAWGMNTPAYFCVDTFRMASDWQSGGVTFSNNYNAVYGSWDGFAYSNMTDTTTPGYGNQYSAIPGGGQGATTNYAVGYVGWASPPTITLPSPAAVSGLFVTNSTYAYLSMLDGDAFSKKFGGETGADEDWFLLTVTGKDADGNSTGAVDFYLADFQDAQSANDYIVSDWRWVDLSALGTVSTLEFTLTSSDTGAWGMNTPAYFCVDSMGISAGDATGTVTTADPIPGYIAGIQNATITLTGSDGSVYNATSDATGAFTFAALPVGVYDMTVSALGFKTVTVVGVMVSLTGGLPNLSAALVLDVISGGDISGNGQVGLEDAIMILQTLTGVRGQQ